MGGVEAHGCRFPRKRQVEGRLRSYARDGTRTNGDAFDGEEWM